MTTRSAATPPASPKQRGFATKPELARVMLERVLDARLPAGWVTADEVYGGSPALRGWLELAARYPPSSYSLAMADEESAPTRVPQPDR